MSQVAGYLVPGKFIWACLQPDQTEHIIHNRYYTRNIRE